MNARTHVSADRIPAPELERLASDIAAWARELGFSGVGIADLDLGEAPQRLRAWLAQGRHGGMTWMERHAGLRADPSTLVAHR